MSGLGQPFVVAAFVAGTPVAAAAGVVGYFLSVRAQVFVSDVLGHVSYAGAVAALAFGVDPRIGLFAATVGVGLVIGVLGPRARSDDVAIGGVLAWSLGLGAFFLTLYAQSAGDGAASVNYLFGSIFGLTMGRAWVSAGVALAVTALVVGVARPLLFASLDGAVAGARGVPVRALGLVLLVATGVVAAEASQVTGALLLLGLVAAPAGAAGRLTNRPFAALWLSCALAVASLWGGLILAVAVPILPPSFAILALAGGTHLAVAGARPAFRVASLIGRAMAARLETGSSALS
ncbi:MAG: metal ABC transporter permease [Acidimicrobiales bacterium]